jgi:hypothetical protein
MMHVIAAVGGSSADHRINVLFSALIEKTGRCVGPEFAAL